MSNMDRVKTFAINVRSNTYRRNRILAQGDVAGVDIQIFDAVTPDTINQSDHDYDTKRARRFTGRPMMETEIACGLSHLQLWRHLQNDPDADHYLILEDDIDIHHNIADIINALDLSDIHFLKLSGQCDRPMKKIKDFILGSKADKTLKQGESNNMAFSLYRYAYGPLDGAAYLISKEGAKKMDAFCRTLHTPIDILMDRTYDHGVTAYGVLPYAASTQFNFDKGDPLYTDIGVRDRKYAPDITIFEKLCVRGHRIIGSMKRRLATLHLHLVKE